ncbi:unnamed protein product [Penicillium salamii]|nr:unnamed protein product [Penicillium salamii]CAG8349566.1 unnamed protein product [Penicillium salamii]CAG8417651.1 unnamed protein product [Penicillium salamii]
MTDLTPTLNGLLSKQGKSITKPTKTADEFLKEAYRINSHITSLLQYLQSIRHSYLSTSQRRNNGPNTQPQSQSQILTDPERDAVDTSTALLLRDLATSIANLSSAESLRQETTSTLLRKKYGHSAASAALWRWAGDSETKSTEQLRAEESARVTTSIREAVLWYLKRGLEGAAGAQRGMVEKRIERVREKEKSVLYKVSGAAERKGSISTGHAGGNGSTPVSASASASATATTSSPMSMKAPDAAVLSEADTAQIEAQLSPEQLQLFAEENDSMLRHYEDTLGKVQYVFFWFLFFDTADGHANWIARNAEKSLLEISSLQETLVTHLATQEEYIFQLVSDVDTTQTNVGQGNRELKRATERRSTAQAVFWGTVGLCTWLVVWDLVF